MDDYSSLAHRIAGGVADVRGCLILSRDGLILGSYPEDEAALKPSWLRFAALGEPERSFVEFPGETWAYLRRGPYAAFAIAGAHVRPGLLIDQLELVLMAAEEARTRRETLKVPESPSAPSGKPRTSLHPPPVVPLEPAALPAGTERRTWSRGTTQPSDAEPSGSKDEASEGSKDEETLTARSGSKDPGNGEGKPDGKPEGKPGGKPEPASAERDPEGSPEPKKRKKDEAALGLEPDAEVDRVLLAKEFSGLLQVEAPDDEAQS